MAAYSYKDVVYREDFQELIPEFEKQAHRECDRDSNYDGDHWTIADMLLTKKDENIRQQQAEIDRLTEQWDRLLDSLKIYYDRLYDHKDIATAAHEAIKIIAEIEAGK